MLDLDHHSQPRAASVPRHTRGLEGRFTYAARQWAIPPCILTVWWSHEQYCDGHKLGNCLEYYCNFSCAMICKKHAWPVEYIKDQYE